LNIHIDTDKSAVSNSETADEKNEDLNVEKNEKNGAEKSQSSKRKKDKRKYVVRKEIDSDTESNSDTERDKDNIKRDKDEGDIVFNNVHDKSIALLTATFGKLPISDFPDLKYRSTEEVHIHLKGIFEDLPDTFLEEYKNPCWRYPASNNPQPSAALLDLNEKGDMAVACLPYAYILGQPKCGTSDLFERLKRHPDIRMPRRKEVRWFTRGEFTDTPLTPDGEEVPRPGPGQQVRYTV
jgi:hypothetical protein